MAKRKWRCAHGCNQAEYLKTTQRACPHLEALLGPHAGLGSRYSVGLEENAGNVPSAEDLLIKLQDEQQADNAFLNSENEPISDEDRFRDKLKAYTLLSPLKVEVLVARMARGMTFKEIAVEFGYADAGTAGRAYRDALEMLQRGVKE